MKRVRNKIYYTQNKKRIESNNKLYYDFWLNEFSKLFGFYEVRSIRHQYNFFICLPI